MGRYYTFSNGDRGKFWFACQDTDDITQFGGYERDGVLYWMWTEDDLPAVNARLKETVEELKDTGYTYRSFMKRVNTVGYLGSSADPETQKDNYKRAAELCARIELGLKIRRGIRQDGHLDAEAEY